MVQRIVIAGLGDTGVLCAASLAKKHEVIAIGAAPLHLSGQELGLRLSRPEEWRKQYATPYPRYRKLDSARIVQARLRSLILKERKVLIEATNGEEESLPFDALVIATGVSNGFWRRPSLNTEAEVRAEVQKTAALFYHAKDIAIVGGGPSGVSSAAALATRYPEKNVHLFVSGDLPHSGYHQRVREKVVRRLRGKGVELHFNSRVQIPASENSKLPQGGTLRFQNSESTFDANLILWCVGNTAPNSDWLPSEILNEQGFVRVDPMLRVEGQSCIYAVGDIAATDPSRSSARNEGHRVVDSNLSRELAGRSVKRRYRPPAYRWGSIFGLEDDGLRVYTPGGGVVLIPRVIFEHFIMPVFVARGIYGGIRSTTQ
ncbi:MAG: FAD-dependent oxidoreductase [Polyangiaceae bacterium]|nr:FAD-dependent oxidoreductase [Polyangiaceae bacterium]